jgi:hypothetical protein
VAAEDGLAVLRADALRRVPGPPGLDRVTEDTGRQRLAAYYLYSALIAAVIRPGDLAQAPWPPEWPPQLAEPLKRLGLTRLAPRTGRALDAQLTPAEQATRRSPGRQLEFARLLVDLINTGAFGPLCQNADSVRLSRDGDRRAQDLELVKDGRVVGTCLVRDHWELVAQYLASAPLGGPPAQQGSTRGPARRTVTQRVEDTAVPHAVSAGVALAVSVHPVGTIAGLGTRLVRSRIRAGRDEADALRGLGLDLRTLRAQADGELADLPTGRTGRESR